jgi:hypothetical protein
MYCFKNLMKKIAQLVLLNQVLESATANYLYLIEKNNEKEYKLALLSQQSTDIIMPMGYVRV